MSTNYRSTDPAADAALALNNDEDHTAYFHTKCGTDEWWAAEFGGRFLVSEIHITNRKNGGPNTMKRLNKSEITVEGQYCGVVEDVTDK